MRKPEVLWEITHKCNGKCIHCISDAGRPRDSELTTSEALNLCDRLAEFAGGVHLLGGEIFLRNDWKQIIERLYALKLKYSVVTNGIALTRDKIKYLKDMGVQVIGLSVDGGNPEVNDYIRGIPGLFNKVFELMDICTEEEAPFSVISTFNTLNVYQADMMFGNMINSPARVWQVQIAAATGRMDKSLSLNDFEFYILGLYTSIVKMKIPNKVLKIAAGHDMGHFSRVIPHFNAFDKWDGCYAGRRTFGINSCGDIFGCLCMMGADDFILGNVLKQPVKELWESESFCPWNQEDAKYKVLKGFCKDCEYGSQCHAGCSNIAYSLTGSLGENPLCYHKIETKWRDKKPANDFEYIFKELTDGFVDPNGNVFLASGNMLNNSLISKLTLDSKQQKLLSLIANI